MNIRGQLDPIVRDVIVNRWISGGWYPRKWRARLLRLVGHDVHPTASVCPGLFLGARTGLTLGDRAFINYGCFFDLGAATTVGKDSALGYGVMVMTCTHSIGGPARRTGPVTVAPVSIGDGVWVGARALIQPGVTIGDGCIIAAGSVVTGDCEPHGLYAGVPATRRRDLDQ